MFFDVENICWLLLCGPVRMNETESRKNAREISLAQFSILFFFQSVVRTVLGAFYCDGSDGIRQATSCILFSPFFFH